MPFTVVDEKAFPHSKTAVYQAALGAIDGLEGKLVSQNADEGMIEVKFHKTVLKKVLGDRTQLTVNLEEGEGETAVHVSCYPLNAVGQKLMFGARKGVSKTVVNWFFAHLEHRLPKD